MGLKDDVLEMKKEVQEVKNQGFAMELLKDARKTNKRMFIIIIILIIAFIGLLGYTIWLLNDIGVIETTTEVQQSDADNNNYIGNNGEIINGTKDKTN